MTTKNTTEQWKPVTVEGFENVYEVSNLGNIRRTGKTTNLTPLHVGGGYLDVILQNNKLRKQIKIHRVVAMAFVENPDNKEYVNHLDENKHNNAADNLGWVTRKENVRWKTAISRMKQSRIENASKVVAMFDKDGNIVDTASRLTTLCRKHPELNYNLVSQCVCGMTKNHKGYTFKYIDYDF